MELVVADRSSSLPEGDLSLSLIDIFKDVPVESILEHQVSTRPVLALYFAILHKKIKFIEDVINFLPRKKFKPTVIFLVKAGIRPYQHNSNLIKEQDLGKFAFAAGLNGSNDVVNITKKLIDIIVDVFDMKTTNMDYIGPQEGFRSTEVKYDPSYDFVQEVFRGAVQRGHLQLVEEYFKKEKFSFRGEKIKESVSIAIHSGYLGVVKFFIRENDRFNLSYFMFQEATKSGHVAILKYLVEECGWNRSTNNFYYETGNFSVPALEYFLSINWFRPGGLSQFLFRYETAKFLIERDPTIMKTYRKTIVNATKMDVVKLFITNGFKVNLKYIELMMQRGCLDIIKFIIEFKKGEFDLSILIESAYKFKKKDIVNFLLGTMSPDDQRKMTGGLKLLKQRYGEIKENNVPIEAADENDDSEDDEEDDDDYIRPEPLQIKLKDPGLEIINHVNASKSLIENCSFSHRLILWKLKYCFKCRKTNCFCRRYNCHSLMVKFGFKAADEGIRKIIISILNYADYIPKFDEMFE